MQLRGPAATVLLLFATMVSPESSRADAPALMQDLVIVQTRGPSLGGLGGVVLASGTLQSYRVESQATDSAVIDLRARLRAAGIRILTVEEASRLPANPLLQVQVVARGRARENRQWGVSLRLYERYCLARMPDSCSSKESWSASTQVDIPTPAYPSGRVDSEEEARAGIAAWKARMAESDSHAVGIVRDLVRQLGEQFIAVFNRDNAGGAGASVKKTK